MKVKAIKCFSSPHTGSIVRGEVIASLNDHIAKQFVEFGLVEEVSSPIAKQEPEKKAKKPRKGGK